MLSKDSKIRVLENFYGLDYVLFGKPTNKIDTCCPLVKEEYLAIKGALMSVHVEMLKLIEHKPKALNETVNKIKLMKNAKSSAKIARENAQRIVTSKKARANIKESLQEALKENSKVNISQLVEKSIRTKAFGLAIDNLLIARTLQEGKCEQLNTWEGRIIEDSYKILRDNLVEAAYMMIYPQEESEDLNEKISGKHMAYAAAGVATGAAARIGYAKYKCRTIEDPEKRKKCVASYLGQHESEDLTEWGSSPAEQMKDAQEEKKQDIMAVRRKCLKYKELGQPEKVKPCVEKGIAQVNAHFAKVFADIKRSM